MNKLILLLALCIFTYSSCMRKCVEYPGENNYLIFGHFYGMCAGEQCIEIYKLGEGTLSEDINDSYPERTSFYTGNYVNLSQQKFNDVKDIINYFPPGLLTEQNTVIGHPDEADGGGLYIEYNYNGVRKFWLIDNNRFYVPAEYHLFMDKAAEKISMLQ